MISNCLFVHYTYLSLIHIYFNYSSLHAFTLCYIYLLYTLLYILLFVVNIVINIHKNNIKPFYVLMRDKMHGITAWKFDCLTFLDICCFYDSIDIEWHIQKIMKHPYIAMLLPLMSNVNFAWKYIRSICRDVQLYMA